MSDPVRLQKYLSAAGVASRRKSEALITEGRVSVNGVVVNELGSKVDPATAEVTVDGLSVGLPASPIYLMMNKPRATVCTESDPEGRERVHDLLPRGLPRLFTIGRLDYDTEGLLLFTNDGDLAAKLTSPHKAVPRVYEVKVQGDADSHMVRRWSEGVRLDDGSRTRPSPTELLSRTRSNAWYSVVLTEGKNRQIHRMAAACGKRVLKLRRVSYGPILLGNLRHGTSRGLAGHEVAGLMAAVQMAPTRRAKRAAPDEAPGQAPARPENRRSAKSGSPEKSKRPKAAHGKPGQSKSWVAKPGQSRPGQSRPGQSQPGQSQPGQSQPGQSRPGQSRPGQDKPSYGRPGQSRPGQDKPGYGRPGQSRAGQDKPGYGRPGQDKPGYGRPGQDKPGYGRPGHDKPGYGKPGQSRTGQGKTGYVKPGQPSDGSGKSDSRRSGKPVGGRGGRPTSGGRSNRGSTPGGRPGGRSGKPRK
ncbi:MAG: 23S rRNA pseudouridine2605 synthase [Myxococcota bacterium]|jgi:23S rRNA pseudouridine2605 synthase